MPTKEVSFEEAERFFGVHPSQIEDGSVWTDRTTSGPVIEFKELVYTSAGERVYRRDGSGFVTATNVILIRDGK